MSEHLFVCRAVVQFVHSYVCSRQDVVLCACVFHTGVSLVV